MMSYMLYAPLTILRLEIERKMTLMARLNTRFFECVGLKKLQFSLRSKVVRWSITVLLTALYCWFDSYDSVCHSLTGDWSVSVSWSSLELHRSLSLVSCAFTSFLSAVDGPPMNRYIVCVSVSPCLWPLAISEAVLSSLSCILIIGTFRLRVYLNAYANA